MATEPAPRTRAPRRDRAERERIVLDAAARLFYARGVHEVGMDELVRATGLGKATVYRLFPTKDALIGGYLTRLAGSILEQVDHDIARSASPAAALHGVLAAVQADLTRDGFRGCAFHNASIEYDDRAHPARMVAREYRAALHSRLAATAAELLPHRPAAARALGAQLAVLVDGAYTSAVHLGPLGPAADGLALAHDLVDAAEDG